MSNLIKFINLSVNEDNVIPNNTGNYGYRTIAYDGREIGVSTTLVTTFIGYIMIDGNYKISAQVKQTTATYTAYIYIYINGVLKYSYSTTSLSYVTASYIAYNLKKGDVITIKCKASGGTMIVREQRIWGANSKLVDAR